MYERWLDRWTPVDTRWYTGGAQLSADPLRACKDGRRVTHEDWLQTLAEIAVALAGFSGLLAGIRQQSQLESKINATRLRTIVETSLAVLAFCLIPVFLNGLGVGEVWAFRISAIAFLAGFIPFTAMGFRRFRLAAGTSVIRVSGFLGGAAIYLASAVALVAGIACAAGFPTAAAPTCYLIALTGTLAIGALNFLGFAIGYSRSEPND